MPVLYLYRHAIELTLKHSCRAAADLVERNRHLGFGPDTVPKDLDNRLSTTHSIARLVELFTAIVDGLQTDGTRLDEKTSGVLATLHRWDDTGTAFRYPTRYDKQTKAQQPIRADEIVVDLESACTRLSEVAKLLDYGVSGFLAAYGEYLSDMESEYRQNLAGEGP